MVMKVVSIVAGDTDSGSGDWCAIESVSGSTVLVLDR